MQAVYPSGCGMKEGAWLNVGKNAQTIEYLENSSMLIGSRKREVVDTEPGETLEVEQVVRLAYGSKNFWKCYLKEFLSVLKSLDGNGKQLKVLIYILENLRPGTNEFNGTYDRIVAGTGCCRQTVSAAMNNLREHDFIRKDQNGVWIVNPDVLMKGNDCKRSQLTASYRNAGIKKKTDTGNTGKKTDSDS